MARLQIDLNNINETARPSAARMLEAFKDIREWVDINKRAGLYPDSHLNKHLEFPIYFRDVRGNKFLYNRLISQTVLILIAPDNKQIPAYIRTTTSPSCIMAGMEKCFKAIKDNKRRRGNLCDR